MGSGADALKARPPALEEDVHRGNRRPVHRLSYGMDCVRIDKWLWAARFFKTRSAAAQAVLGGRVHINGARVKPSKELRVGDTVDVTIRALKRTVEVRGLSDKRGPAPVAAALYEETPESIRAREQDALERRLAARPTKLDRRRLEALRRANRQRRPR